MADRGGKRRGGLALDGVRILDLTEWIAGPYCSYLLAGLGADVLKIEPPGGDPARRCPPFATGAPDGEGSLLFLHLNRGKRSLVLDPRSARDRSRFEELLQGADLVLLDGAPGRALSVWGLTPDGVRARTPGLVLVALTAFPHETERTDWRGTELVISAASGIASCTGEPDRAPLQVGASVCLVAQGQTAAAASLASLFQIRRGVRGHDVEVAAVEASADLLEMWACGLYQQRPMPRMGRGHNSNYPFEVYPARDGLVGVHAAPAPWPRFVEMVGAPELENPEYSNPAARMRDRSMIDEVLHRWLAGLGKHEAYHTGQAHRFAFGYVATTEDLVNSPQLSSRGYFRTGDHPSTPGALYPGPPFRMASGWQESAAPVLGAAGETGWLEAEHARPVVPPGARERDPLAPLAGLRVLDLTQIWAGPRATKVLADYGADVIKVESPERTDGTRGYARYLEDRRSGTVASEREHNRRTQFEQLHRGQRSVVLDLRSREGKDAFDSLVRTSDVVIANFAAGVIERLGITWDELRKLNERIILISMTSFGDDGPERDYVAYGVTQEELSGLYGLTGYDADTPLKSGSNVGDPMNGMHGAVAVMGALIERERTGMGQYIELSQLESSLPFIGEVLLDFTVNGAVTRPRGNGHPLWSPHGIYPTLGDDEWIALVVRSDDEWAALLDELGDSELRRDPRFGDGAGRLAHRLELDARLERLTAGRERTELASALQRRGIAASPVLNSLEVQGHPEHARSGFVQVIEHPDGGSYRYFGPLWRVNGRRPPVRGPAPLLGEHQDEVVRVPAGRGAARPE